MYYVVTNDQLAHHGILGQKWGVRRYQNEDGSLTNAGKKRYAKEAVKELNKYEKEAVNAIAEYNKHDMARNRYASASMTYRERNNYSQADKYSKKAHDEDKLATEAEKKVKDIDAKIWNKVADVAQNGFDVKMKDVTRIYRDRVAVGSTVVTSLLTGGAAALGTFAAPGAGTTIGLTAATTMANVNRLIEDSYGHRQEILSKKYKVFANASGGIGNVTLSESMAAAQTQAVRDAIEEVARRKYGE